MRFQFKISFIHIFLPCKFDFTSIRINFFEVYKYKL